MDFQPLAALTGGIFIGLSVTLLLWLNGRIGGISGITHVALFAGPNAREGGWRWLFLLGLVGGAAIYNWLVAPVPLTVNGLSPWAVIIGGFFVGFGTRLGNGCTSGHGVCGIGRLSPRSLVATLIFMLVAMVTVFVTQNLL